MSYSVPLCTTRLEVIVVDPQPQSYLSLVEACSGEGVIFQFAASASGALRLRPSSPQSLWLVNMRLADCRGSDLLAALRERDPHSIVYLVSDQYLETDELEARQSGASMYLCKPASDSWLALWDIRRLARCA
jgi:CheY-like chemotaxis protein